MRILWVINVDTSTDEQTAAIVPRLKEAGHEVALSTSHAVLVHPTELGSVPVPSSGNPPARADTIVPDADWWQADAVITLTDPATLLPPLMERVKWCPWLPVDHLAVPPQVADALRAACQPIAGSKYAQAKLRKAGFDALYAPHGIDTKTFRPMRERGRAHFNLSDDTFLVGIVAPNDGCASSWSFDEQIRAFALFHHDHPQSKLYLHTNMFPRGGPNLWQLLKSAGVPDDAVLVVNQHQYRRGLISPPALATAYSALDVLLNVTRGEGFGTSMLQAQACGTPVISGNWTAMPELTGSGWLVNTAVKVRSRGTYQQVPWVEAIVERLQDAYAAHHDESLRQKARAFAVSRYDADHVFAEYWQPALTRLGKAVGAARHPQVRVTTPDDALAYATR